MISLRGLTALPALALFGACTAGPPAHDAQIVVTAPRSPVAQCNPQPATNGQVTTCQVRIPVQARTAGATGGILILQRRYLSVGMDTALLPEASRMFNQLQVGFLPPDDIPGPFVLQVASATPQPHTIVIPLENTAPDDLTPSLTTEDSRALYDGGPIVSRNAAQNTQGYALDRQVVRIAADRLSATYLAVAKADTHAWLTKVGAPAEITPVDMSCSKSVFPLPALKEGREGLDVSRCAVSQDGTIGPCASLRSMGGNDFAPGNASFLRVCHARSKGTAPMPFHDFQTVFGFGD